MLGSVSDEGSTCNLQNALELVQKSSDSMFTRIANVHKQLSARYFYILLSIAYLLALALVV